MRRPRILIAFPTGWDLKRLGATSPSRAARFEPIFAAPTDEECPWDLDILGWIDRADEDWGPFDGVVSSSDYPGATAAAAVAARLGLPGAPPDRVLTVSHKYYSRRLQREVVPEATPRFALVDPSHPEPPAEVPLPFFLKPVRASFSMLAQRIDTAEELRRFLGQPAVAEFTGSYLHLFDRLVERYTGFSVGASAFLAEELLVGGQVTVEGFVTGGEVEILGVVDSVMYPGTGSFARFDYPSSLPAAVQARMAGIARRLISATGLEATLFNVEMTYDPAADRIGIVEINPRMCGQFADLYEKVDGTNSYEVALSLAAGEHPRFRHRAGPYPLASSVALRTFRPVRVRRAPGEREVARAESLFPGTLVWPECHAGQELADFGLIEDGSSYRYAVINLGATDRRQLLDRLTAVRDELGFELEPIE